MPNIIEREQWGAEDGGGTRRNLSVVTTLVGHYTTGQHLARQADDTRGWWRAIQRHHQEGRGWADIGYHFGIDRFGQVLQGRPIEVVGAHVRGFNTPSVGVAFLGTDNRNVEDLTVEFMRSFNQVREHVEARVGRKLDLSGHRDHGRTACPGDEMYDYLIAGAPMPRLHPEPIVDGGEDGHRSNYVTVGDKGPEVRALQVELARLLPDHPDAHTPDGDFGEKTRRLVLAAYDMVGLKASDASQPRVGPRSMDALTSASPRREPWRSKRVVARTDVRFYRRPGWHPSNPTAGILKAGWGFRGGIHDLRGGQYQVSNSSGDRYWITASERFIRLLDR